MYEFMRETVVSFGFCCVLGIDIWLLGSGLKALIRWIRNKLRK